MLLLAALAPGRARAIEGQVSASSDVQLYTSSSPYGSPTLVRRRYTQTLGLDLDRLAGDRSASIGMLSFRSLMRLDADFGQRPAESDPQELARFVPGLAPAPLDLVYAYLDGDRLLGQWLAVRVGRQYVVDALGWWSFDGGRLRVGNPRIVRAELYGGFEQRAVLPLALSRFTADGVYRGVRDELEPDVWPSFLSESRPAPAWGAAIESVMLPAFHARVDYRKVIQRDAVVVSPFPDPAQGFELLRDERVSSERAGGELGLVILDRLGLEASAVYDLGLETFSEQAAALDWFTSDRVTLGAEVERTVPSFDLDSIFNYFAQADATTALLRGRFDLDRRSELATSAGGRWLRVESAPGADEPAGTERGGRFERDALLELALIRRWIDGSVRLAGTSEAGGAGHRLGADLALKHLLSNGVYDVLALLSLWDWHDALRPERDATSFGYVVGGGLHAAPNSRFGVEWEHTTNRLVGQRFRVLATLDLRVPL